MSDAGFDALSCARLTYKAKQIPDRKPRIDYRALQQDYQRLMVEGQFTSKAALARHLGVSRVWVSRVLKGIQRRKT